MVLDEDVRKIFLNHLRILNNKDRTPRRFKADLESHFLLRTIPRAPAKISLRTATRWMHLLNFSPENLPLQFVRKARNHCFRAMSA